MKKYTLLLFLASIVILSACSSKKQGNGADDGIPVINLSDNVQEVKSLPLSDIATDVEIVPLEITDSSLIGSITNIYVGEQFIWLQQFKDQSVYRFSRDGKFVNQINKQGNGPGEYIYLKNFFVDEDKRELYLESVTNGIYAYDWDGNLKRRVATYETMGAHHKMTPDPTYYRIQDQFLATASYPVLTLTNKDSLWSFAVLDSSFHFKKLFKNPAYTGREEEILKRGVRNPMQEQWTEAYVNTSLCNGQLSFLFDGTDTIYGYKSETETLAPLYALHSKEEKGDYSETHRWRKARKVFKYHRITAHYVTTNYVYLFGIQHEKSLIYCYDRHSGQVRLLRGEGEITERPVYDFVFYGFRGTYLFENDICGGTFFPCYTRQDKYWVDEWTQKRANNSLKFILSAEAKDENKREQFVKELEKLDNDEEANPVLVIAKLK